MTIISERFCSDSPTNLIFHRITNYTPDLKSSDVDRIIRQALNVWSAVTPLTFRKLHEGTADIMISFGSRGTKAADFY